MRKLFLLGCVVALALGFAGVSAQDMYSGVDPTGVKLTYWHQYSKVQQETIEALAAQFNETNEYGITVEAIPQGSYNDIRDLMNAAIISGELPNLVAGYQSDALSYYRDDAALDLHPLIDDATYGYSAEEMANLNQGILNIDVFEDEGGVMLAWPNTVSASVQAINMDMLAALGFDAAPEDYDTFMAISCAAAQAEGTQGYPITLGASEFENFLAAMGAEIIVDGQWDFTSDAAVAALQLYADLYSQNCGYIPEEAYQNTKDFAYGLNPMANTSTAGIPFILSDMGVNETENGVAMPNWLVTTVPWTDDNRTIQLYAPSIIVVPATPEEEVASWLFLKFLTSVESQITWTTATSYFPINLEAARSLGDFEATNPYFAQANAIIADPTVTIYSSPKVISYNAVRDLIAAALADVTSNGRDVMEVAQELTDKANAVQQDLE
jgi:ABC-type glycerol-3-phosphate transport system substrate-binding protein